MYKKAISLFTALAMALSCGACASAAQSETVIVLSDSGVTVDGAPASSEPSAAVYTGADIVYYESGRGETYGAGTDADAHDPDEAGAHTVVTITQPGVYRVSGRLTAGQLAVDLGEGAESDPAAVVTLILDGADITCSVAPAVIFYRVYECASSDTETASPTVDTSAAGANVVLADGSVNQVNGSYVAKIYKEGTEKKLHKYDGAFYSKMSMNITGGSTGTGILHITAENEGLDSELHLTVNGGVINITAQNDGINTNEDGVSVTTVNGGALFINAGLGAEGDGIDSNGYLVVNGGSVTALANGKSGDGGLDSDMGIYLNGGTVIALGSRNDALESASTQPYLELSFASTLPAGSVLTLKDSAGTTLFDYTSEKAFASAILSSPDLSPDETYSLYVNGIRQQYTSSAPAAGGHGGMTGGGPSFQDDEGPELPDGAALGEPPQDGRGFGRPDGMAPPENQADPGFGRAPGSGRAKHPSGAEQTGSTAFSLTGNAGRFSGISDASVLPFSDIEAASAGQTDTPLTRGELASMLTEFDLA